MLMQRIVLTGFLSLVSQPFVRLLMGLMTSLLYLVLLLSVKPFKEDSLDAFAAASNFSLVAIFLGALCMYTFQEVTLKFGEFGDVSEVFGFSSTTQIVAIILIFSFSVLIILSCTIAYQLWNQQSLSVLRLTETSRPPELHLQTRKTFHLFLSQCAPPRISMPRFPWPTLLALHRARSIWSSGQGGLMFHPALAVFPHKPPIAHRSSGGHQAPAQPAAPWNQSIPGRYHASIGIAVLHEAHFAVLMRRS